MTKIYYKEINKCDQCPNIGADANITRYECRAFRNKMIIWMGFKENFAIPKWCPLKDKEN